MGDRQYCDLKETACLYGKYDDGGTVLEPFVMAGQMLMMPEIRIRQDKARFRDWKRHANRYSSSMASR